MHMHIVTLLVMLIVVVLVIMHYLTSDTTTEQGKTATAKKLGAERGISVRDMERRLDANLFLDEIPRWEPSGPHHLYLYQRMFAHAEAISQKEYDQGVHWGCQQPSPERDV